MRQRECDTHFASRVFRERFFATKALRMHGELWALAQCHFTSSQQLTFINSIFSPDSLKEAGVKRKVTLFKSRRLSPLSGRSREIPQNSTRDSHVHISTTLLQLHPFSPVVHIIQCRSSHVYTHRQHMGGTDRQIDARSDKQKVRNRAGRGGKIKERVKERERDREKGERKRKRQIVRR